MALNPINNPNQDYNSLTAPIDDYIVGRIKNNPTAGAGTKLGEELLNDIVQFFAKSMKDAGLTYNNSEDNTNGNHQLFDAVGIALMGRTAWTEVTTFDGDNEQNSNPSYLNLQYRKINGRVEVVGRMIQNTGNGFVLPVGFRPSKSMLIDATNGFGEPVTVDQSGGVFTAGGSGITSAILSYNFSFPLL